MCIFEWLKRYFNALSMWCAICALDTSCLRSRREGTNDIVKMVAEEAESVAVDPEIYKLYICTFVLYLYLGSQMLPGGNFVTKGELPILLQDIFSKLLNYFFKVSSLLFSQFSIVHASIVATSVTMDSTGQDLPKSQRASLYPLLLFPGDTNSNIDSSARHMQVHMSFF